MNSSEAPLIFVLDDNEAFRDSMRWMLRAAGYRVAEYATGEHFLAAHAQGSGACLILDLRMPGMSGLEVQEMLLQRREHLPIIFVTAHGDIPLAVKAMKRGAADFVEKPFNGRTLLSLVRKVLRQQSPQLAAAANRIAVADRLTSLSQREHEVMMCVLDGKTNKLIANHLGISIKTVECHRSRMMEKLGASSIADLFRLVGATSVMSIPPKQACD